MQADITTTWTPSFCLVEAVSEAGEDWLAEHTDLDWCGGPVEHRYIVDIVLGALDGGIAVMDTASGRFAGAEA